VKESPRPDLFGNGGVDIKWQEGTPAPVPCINHTAMLLEGKVYIGGGNEGTDTPSYRIDVYDLAENSWNPTPIITPYCNFAMTTLNKRLIIAGGHDKRHKVTNMVFSLDGDLKKYTKMLTSRGLATAASHQGTLIITGGEGDRHKKITSTELFDSSTGQWYATDHLPLPHCRLQAVIVNDNLYLLGGIDVSNDYSPAVFTASLETLSSHILKWESHPEYSACQTAPVSIQDRHLLVIGGTIDIMDHHFMPTRDIRKFNKVGQNWIFMGYLRSPRWAAAAVFVGDNTLIVFGGLNEFNDCTSTVWIGSCEPYRFL